MAAKISNAPAINHGIVPADAIIKPKIPIIKAIGDSNFLRMSFMAKLQVYFN